jgi:formate dehydrogenase subunit delta
MRTERLVTMANDIAAFFDVDPDRALAPQSVASHLRRFWDPRMRREIVRHYREGGAGLSPAARSGIGLIADETAPATPGPRI